MAEQVFRSPGFFPREIEQTFKVAAPAGVPAGIIGTAEKGPAFVPVLISSFKQFIDTFGEIEGDKFAPYAVREFLQNGGSCVFVRILGAGANTSQTDINNTQADGTVRNAGFQLSPATIRVTTGNDDANVTAGCVFFLVAEHSQSNLNFPMLGESRFGQVQHAQLIRAMIFTENNTRIFAGSYGTQADGTTDANKLSGTFAHAITVGSGVIDGNGLFKLYISSSAGTAFSNNENRTGVKILTASLDPNNVNYIRNILNADPAMLEREKHLLYAAFDVDDEIATTAGNDSIVAVVSGTAANNASSVSYLNAFGRFDTRYTTPKSPYVISQPYGTREYELFYVESLSDGAYANNKFKITVTNLKKSAVYTNPYGIFTLQVRNITDTDESPVIYEQYAGLNLDPKSDNYIGRRIGDEKITFDFDQTDPNERRSRVSGKYPNVSKLIRVVLSDDLDQDRVPSDALPCGFRGYELLKTTSNELENGTWRMYWSGSGTDASAVTRLTGAILPPIPYRRKITKGQIDSNKESIDQRLTWGVQFSRVSGSASEPNKSAGNFNFIVDGFSKFLGIRDFDMLVTGAAADVFNNNKFTLDKVNTFVNTTTNLNTSSLNDSIKAFTYFRNRNFTNKSLADVLSTPPDANGIIDITFNRFSAVTGFSFFLYGGFDGVDITNKDARNMTDKATSTQTGGLANTSVTNVVLGVNQSGTDLNNSSIQSYKRAIEVLSNPDTVDINLLAIPGIREPLITDYAADKMRDRFDAFFIMDLEQMDKDGNRLFDDSAKKPNVQKTIDTFLQRGIDEDFAVTYFPDTIIETGAAKRITVPPSVVVLGAYAFNDSVGQPWFAPAGFNRGGLASAKKVDLRLSFNDRDNLYDASINPIASFPHQGIVVFGQKTLKASQSALDRVNVRRLLIEVRRAIRDVGNTILFEPNRAATIESFVKRINPILQRVQIQAGIENFKVKIDNTTTTQEDIENNTIRGQIFITPTKTAEFIAVDFIVTDAGVQFE